MTRLLPIEPVDRVAVTVTFLRMSRAPADPSPAWPENVRAVQRERCSVSEFRALYDGVGADYVWWLRRTVPDRELAAHLKRDTVLIHVLEIDGQVGGFHELDRAAWPVVNLSYFGLLPHAVGRGLGRLFLRHAVDLAWSWKPSALTVNTCSADHPRALRSYVSAGFEITRAVPEIWSVPRRLGLRIPEALRAP